MATQKKSGKTSTSVKEREDSPPGEHEREAMRDHVRRCMQKPRMARIRGFLERLAASSPPQVILLEGGHANQRVAAAVYWALLLNCPDAVAGGQPCLACPNCLRMLLWQHRDSFFFDGRVGSIKIDEVRGLLPTLGEPPREARYRIVVFCEAQALGDAAANALLKSLEEPCPGTSFVLLAPLRGFLLPTLVSRSCVLTLPWPDAMASGAPVEQEEDSAPRIDLIAWEADICRFIHTGQGLFERTGVKGTVDAGAVQELTGYLRRALVRRLSGRTPGDLLQGLDAILAPLPDARLRILDEALAECQESLNLGVNPTLMLEWLLTRLFLLAPRQTRV